MTKEKIWKFICKNGNWGYKDVQYLGKYNNMDVYEPILSDEFQNAEIGLPELILVKDDNMQWFSGKKIFDTLDYFNK